MKLKMIFWAIVYVSVYIASAFTDIKVCGFCGGVLWILGTVVTLYALALTFISGRTLKKFAHKEPGSGFVPDKFTDKGIYSCMRHPMHLGIGLLPFGLALLSGNLGAILASGWALAAAFWFVLEIEEPEVIESYGQDYINYMQKVPSFKYNLKCLEKGLYGLKQKPPLQENSKVEVTGLEAKHYDRLMDLITFGWYRKFIRQAIGDIGLKDGDKVADFGAGTGRNAVLMREHIGSSGEIVGFEIGKEMKEQFLQKSRAYKNILLAEKSIIEPLKEEEKFDFVFISFVLHGFTKENRQKIIQNAYNLLKKGGTFAILDYNEFDVEHAPFIYRFGIKFAECPLAEEFINTDIKKILQEQGFGEFESKTYQKGHIRLLKAKKV